MRGHAKMGGWVVHSFLPWTEHMQPRILNEEDCWDVGGWSHGGVSHGALHSCSHPKLK